MARIWTVLKNAWGVLYDAADGFTQDRGIHLSAGMAFYAIFSIAPFILIATAISGFVFGRDIARAEVISQISEMAGPEAAEFILTILKNWRDPSAGVIATVIGSVTTLYLAFRVFDALRDMLNILWNVRLRPDITWGQAGRKWTKSFLMMFIVGPMLLISIVLSEVLTRLGPALERLTGWDLGLGAITSFAVSFFILMAMFAAIYKWLPDVHIDWRDVMFGAAVTALLFSVGRSLIAVYMARASTASLFGAAGSLVVLLFWIYYSAQILFFGAEITEVYAERYGRGIRPDSHAIHIHAEKGAVMGQSPDPEDRDEGGVGWGAARRQQGETGRAE